MSLNENFPGISLSSWVSVEEGVSSTAPVISTTQVLLLLLLVLRRTLLGFLLYRVMWLDSLFAKQPEGKITQWDDFDLRRDSFDKYDSSRLLLLLGCQKTLLLLDDHSNYHLWPRLLFASLPLSWGNWNNTSTLSSPGTDCVFKIAQDFPPISSSLLDINTANQPILAAPSENLPMQQSFILLDLAKKHKHSSSFKWRSGFFQSMFVDYFKNSLSWPSWKVPRISPRPEVAGFVEVSSRAIRYFRNVLMTREGWRVPEASTTPDSNLEKALIREDLGTSIVESG